MNNDSTQRKAGAILSYVNLGLGSIVPLIYTPIMLSLLGQAEYGLYSLSGSVIGYLSLLSLGLGTSIVRYIAKFRAEDNVTAIRGIIGLFLVIYGCLAILVLSIGGVLSWKADKLFAAGLTDSEANRLQLLMVIMMITTAISLPISVFSSIITAYERFIFARVLAIIFTVGTPVLNLIALYAGGASIAMALVTLLIQISTGIIWGIYCFKILNLPPLFSAMPTHLLKEIWVFTAFVFLASIVDMLYWATDQVLIGATLGTVAVAIYHVGGTFTSILQNLSHALSNMFTPVVMRMNAGEGRTSPAATTELMIRVGRIQSMIVSFVLSGYAVFGQCFIKLWAGPGYGEAYWVALLTMVPLSVPLIQNIAFSSLLAQNKHRFRSILYAIIAVINVITTYLIIPYAGIIGAAACTAVSFVVGNGIIMNIYYQRVIHLGIGKFWANILRVILIPLAMTAGGYLLVNVVFHVSSWIPFLIGVGVYSIIFWLLIWFFSMNSYEKGLFTDMWLKTKRFIIRK